MNPEQQQSYIRSTLLTMVGAVLGGAVVKGWITADQATAIGGGVVALIMAGGAYVIARWGSSSHSAVAVTAAVNSDSAPGVKVVPETSPAPAVNLAPSGAIVPVKTPPK